MGRGGGQAGQPATMHSTTHMFLLNGLNDSTCPRKTRGPPCRVAPPPDPVLVRNIAGVESVRNLLLATNPNHTGTTFGPPGHTICFRAGCRPGNDSLGSGHFLAGFVVCILLVLSEFLQQLCFLLSARLSISLSLLFLCHQSCERLLGVGGCCLTRKVPGML